MEYKLLLSGKNDSIINDFFTQTDDCFELLTTSERLVDISNHLKFFDPDFFVYCLGQNSIGALKKMDLLKNELTKADVPFAIIGTEGDCNIFKQFTGNIADLTLFMPVNASAIETKINDYMKVSKRQEKRAKRAEAERIEQERAKRAEAERIKQEEAKRAETERIKQEEAKRAEAERIKQEEAKRAEAERIAQEKAVQKKHILVVDDDPLMLRLIKEHLHEEYNVATANSGRTALKFLEKRKTNLILLDYEMPVEDGPAVLKKLHAIDATKNIPVVFLTGISDYSSIQKALEQKPQGYLLKPVDRKRLFDTIQGILGKN